MVVSGPGRGDDSKAFLPFFEYTFPNSQYVKHRYIKPYRLRNEIRAAFVMPEIEMEFNFFK